MFYSQFILAKKGPLGTIWIAAHLERKLRKNQVADTDIGVSVDSIIFPEVPIALRLSSHLLLGVVRIYSRKVNYLFDDCSEALLKIKQAFRSTAVDLPPEESTAPYHSITLPETFDLDDFELPDNETYQGNYVDHHVSSREQITLQDSMEGVVYATSQFGLDERFGDGDASQIGLDLDEELFLENVKSQVGQEVSNCSPITHESNRTVTLLDIKDGFDEGRLEASEAIVMDFVDQTEVPADNTEFVEYAQAPCTPGLLEEPNRTSAQKAHECDDHLEAEDHNVTDFVVENDQVSEPSKPDSFCAGDNGSGWTSRHDFDDGHLPIDLESKQVKSEIPSTVSAVRHNPEGDYRTKLSHFSGYKLSGRTDVLDVHAMNESEDACNGDFLSNRSTHCVDQMEVDCIIADRLNGSLTSGVCSGANDVEIHSGRNSPLHKSLASNGYLVDGQVSPKVSKDSKELVLPDKISDAVLPQESPMVCEVGNSEVPSIDDPNHNETSVSVMCKKMSSGEKPVLWACNSVSKLHETSSIGGEESHLTNPMKLGSEKNELSEAALCGEADCKVSDEHLDNATPSDNPSVNVNSSTTPELSAPERLLSVPDALSSPGNLLVDFSTPDKDIMLGNTDGSDAVKPTSGKKRNFAESALTVHSLNSLESVGVARSKRTTEYIPDDDDLLSSILVGRKSSVLKMKPTPPVAEIMSIKRPRSAVRAASMKRKVLMDDSMVLHGDVIRQQLMSTEDIRRVRKKAPCTHPEISMIQRQFLEDEIFNETILSGMSGQLMVLQCETLNFSGVRVSDYCQENASEVAKDSMPAVIPNIYEESRIGENNESAIIRNGTELPPADTFVQTEKGQVEELNLDSRDFQTPVQETVIPDVLELQTQPDHLQGEITNMEFERGNFEVTNLATESTTYGLGYSSPRVRVGLLDTEGPLPMDTSCFSSEMRLNFEHVTDASTRNHKEGLATNNLDHNDEVRDLYANCFETTVPHATIISEDDGCKSRQLLLGVTNEGEMRDEDTGFDDKDPTSSCLNDEVAKTDSSTVGPKTDINGVEHTRCPESNAPNIIDASVLTVDHSTEEDPSNFENLTAGNDTEFLNVDDDEIVEDEEGEEFAGETRFVENSGWSSRTRAVGKYLQTLFDDEAIKGKKVLAMDNLLVRKSRKEAARMFFETLVLKTRDYVHVEQAKPFDNINIKPREKLIKSIF